MTKETFYWNCYREEYYSVSTPVCQKLNTVCGDISAAIYSFFSFKPLLCFVSMRVAGYALLRQNKAYIVSIFGVH